MPRWVTTLALLLATAAYAEDIAFTHVHVVAMDELRVMEDVTVLVRGGRIVDVGRVAPPEGCRVIDAKGRFLMPGLSDMHVHNWYETEHALFLANGVTRIRNMWGSPRHLLWSREIEQGKRLGPNLFTTSPILDGAKPVWEKSIPVATPEDARRIVRDLKKQGYPAIKVYDRLQRNVYEALVLAARREGLRVSGHVPRQAGILEALRLHQDCIEHLEGYVAWPYRFNPRIEADIERTANAGTWNCPTLVVFQKRVPLKEALRLFRRPEMRYVPPRLRATWNPELDPGLKDATPAHFEELRGADRLRMRVAAALHRATGRVLLGTDAGYPLVVAGYSVHEELANLVEAGLTPFDALGCATTKPARFLRDGTGTVRVGERADLVLLEKNPLEDVGHARNPLGVMIRGRWLDRAELDRMLEAVADSYGKPKRRFEGMPALPEGETVRFRVFWNDLVVGEERFVATEDFEIVAQQVNDEPWSVRKTMRLRFDQSGYVQRLEATFEDVFGKRSHVLKVQPGVFYGYPMLASWMATERHLRGLQDGETTEFDYRELDLEKEPELLTVRVRVRRESEREYTIWMKRPDATYRSTLTVDRRGWPEKLVTKLQMGTVRFERAR